MHSQESEFFDSFTKSKKERERDKEEKIKKFYESAAVIWVIGHRSR